MRSVPRMAVMFAVLAFAPLALTQTQQKAPAEQPCSASPQPAPCKTAPAADNKKSTTEQFPFPGESPAPNAPSSAPAAPPAVPDAPTAPSGKAFPFPGEPAAPGSAGGSSSSSSDSTVPEPDSTGDTNPANPEGRRLLKRVNPTGEKLQSPEQREAEDLKIGKFYTDTGDLKGAYLRGEDAVKTMPDNPDAHCMLAETALKLNKRDEAIAEFNACLKLDPVDKQAKNARKELAKLK